MSTMKPYPWLATVGLLPRAVTHALALLGTEEVMGSKSCPAIMAWRDELEKAGVKGVKGFSDDSVPWCGLAQAIFTLRAGKTPIDDPLWALNWGKYGIEVARNAGTIAVPRLAFDHGREASLGDVLVFQRKLPKGGYAGHTGRYIAEDHVCYHVIGGNQGDAVTITRVEKARCVAIRRDVMKVPPASLKPYHVEATGSISHNEA